MIAHAQLIDPADISRFAELGVVVVAQPLWAQLDGLMTVLTIPRIGEFRSAGQYPLRSLAESGAQLAFGSDWPVSSPNPLWGIATAVSRQTAHGDPVGGWIPGEKLSIERALTAYSAGVAYPAFADRAEAPWGSLAVGSSADLVVLDADPRFLTAEQIRNVAVLQTYLRGQALL